MVQTVPLQSPLDRTSEERVQSLVEQGYEVFPVSNLTEEFSQVARRPVVILVCNCQRDGFPHAFHGVPTADDSTYAADSGNSHQERNGHSLGSDNEEHPEALADAAGPSETASSLEFGYPLSLDENIYEARLNGTTLPTSATEFRLLSLLVKNTPQVVNRTELLIRVWGPEYTGDPNVLRLYIHSLRRKIDDAGGDANWIRNIPTIGYSFQAEPAA